MRMRRLWIVVAALACAAPSTTLGEAPWRDKSDVRLDSLIYGGSIFAGLKTPLGPVFLGYGHAERGHGAVYLTFGSLLRPEQ